MKEHKSKEELRNYYKNERDFLNTNFVDKSSEIIFHSLINFLKNFSNFNTIMSYVSFRNEVKTNKINDYLINTGATLVLPKISNDTLFPIETNNLDDFVISKFGIKEPIGKIFDKKIDIIIVPGIVFDKNGNRIGFGKGYYDKFLQKHNGYKIAISFDLQVVDSIPSEIFDEKVDLIITEKKIYNINTFSINKI
ncbi:5-formyltetrahydrofolate cyclo-ligase [Fusobacterium sp. PH5-44]|uniref:5-formyltetrahydrofolate cyclo-ligase n=1 Tax=unclassified Fusobacterium TaxID=2648384 RepID=UPI003D22AFFD